MATTAAIIAAAATARPGPIVGAVLGGAIGDRLDPGRSRRTRPPARRRRRRGDRPVDRPRPGNLPLNESSIRDEYPVLGSDAIPPREGKGRHRESGAGPLHVRSKASSPPSLTVIPARAGIQERDAAVLGLDSCLRGMTRWIGAREKA